MFCPAPTASAAEYASWNVTEAIGPYQDDLSSSMLAQPLDYLQVGETRYQFVRHAQLNWLPTAKGWVCHILELTGYAGEADTPEHAFAELKVQVHTDFQVLLRKRPFEMDEVQRSKWVRLTSVIDLLHYRTTTPLTTQEIGQIHFDQIARPHRIEWINDRSYVIDVERVPAELMSYATGQWIEATVKHHPVDHRILQIESVRKISFRIPTKTETKSLWEKMPKAEVEAGQWHW